MLEEDGSHALNGIHEHLVEFALVILRERVGHLGECDGQKEVVADEYSL